jgi:hypothetical protein
MGCSKDSLRSFLYRMDSPILTKFVFVKTPGSPPWYVCLLQKMQKYEADAGV